MTLEEAIENIDIGGPSMVRAAAKNYRDVVVITNPASIRKSCSNCRRAGWMRIPA